MLAEPIFADRDLPPFRRATRDGFAVLASDLNSISQGQPVSLRVVAEIAAGFDGALPEIRSGEAAEIMTGAPLPPGADAVVMVERTRRNGRRVIVEQAVKTGENFVPRGAEAKQGQQLLPRGVRIDYAAIAIAASTGRAAVEVFQQPKVAIISTGDEVVEVNANPGPHQIRNSNSFSLAAQVLAAGGEPVQLPIAPDEPRVLRDLIARGLQAELLLLSGGVSMGKHDHVEQVLREFDVEFFFTGALIQPGRPIVFGRAYNKERKPGYFFGLPGNPVSTMVTFKLFAAPLIQALAAAEPKPLSFVRVKLKSEVRTKTGLTRFLPAHLTGEGAQTFVELLPWQGSGDIVSVASADCYAVIPPDRDRIEAGEMLPVLLT